MDDSQDITRSNIVERFRSLGRVPAMCAKLHVAAAVAIALGDAADYLGSDDDGSNFVLLRLDSQTLDALLMLPGVIEDLEDDDPLEDCEPTEDDDGTYIFRNTAVPVVARPAIAECRLQDLRGQA